MPLSEIGKTKIVLMSFEMGGAIIGNVFLLVLIYRSRKLRCSASLNFIFNCGLSDLANTMINIPMAMDYSVVKTGNLDGPVMPVLVSFFITFLLFLSFHSTLVMMADRYLLVKYPVKYNNMATAKKARYTIGVIWLSTFLFSVVLSGIKALRNPPTANERAIDFMKQQYQDGGKFFVLFVSIGIFTSVAVLCGKLYKVLQALLKNNHENDSTSEVELLKQQAERRKIASSCRTVLIILVIYMLAYFPTMLNSILKIFNVQLTQVENMRAVFILLCANLSSFFNPIVFILRSSTIRNSAVGMLTRARSQNIPLER